MKKIFVVDIGGTNSRFAMFEVHTQYSMSLINSIWLKTGDASTFDELVEQQEKCCQDLAIADCDALVIAVPGPVIDEKKVEMVNVTWAIDIQNLKKRFDLPVYIINDFMAQGYGCLIQSIEHQIKIKDGTSRMPCDVAVVGAGTGLGHCYLKSTGSGNYVPIPAEAGQIPYPFINKEELEFRAFIMKKIAAPYPTGDIVVSGPGLSLLHAFLTGEDLIPDQVARKITPQCDTTKWFARFYARSCRNYCLTKLSASLMLIIAGGLAAHYPFLVNNDVFRNEFVTSTLKSPYLDQIPIYLNTNENNGLWGAALYGFLSSLALSQ
jgi:glucokinase